MNENSNEQQPKEDGFFRSLIKDDGVQRAVAGVVVAAVVAGAKRLIFGGSES